MRRATGFIVLVLVMAPAAAIAASPDAPSAAPGFVTGVLPVAPSSGAPVNQDAEPGLAVAGDGTFWIASDIAPFAADDKRVDPVGVLSGADIWKSTDGGRSYRWVADPFAANGDQSFGLAGEDTDIA